MRAAHALNLDDQNRRIGWHMKACHHGNSGGQLAHALGLNRARGADEHLRQSVPLPFIADVGPGSPQCGENRLSKALLRHQGLLA